MVTLLGLLQGHESLAQIRKSSIGFYTAPTNAPLSIEGIADGIVTANACLAELRDHLDQWDAVSHPREMEAER
jgi:Asp/Glu/hydantoin racemase